MRKTIIPVNTDRMDHMKKKHFENVKYYNFIFFDDIVCSDNCTTAQLLPNYMEFHSFLNMRVEINVKCSGYQVVVLY